MSKLTEIFAANPAASADVSSLIYLAEKVSSGPDVYEDAGMKLDDLFRSMLPRYAPVNRNIMIGCNGPFTTETGNIYLRANGTADTGDNFNICVGDDSRTVFGGGSVAVGRFTYSGGSDNTCVGHYASTGNFQNYNTFIGRGVNGAGFADTDWNCSLAGLFNGNTESLKLAGIGVRDFSDLTEDGSLVLGGELRSMAPISGQAGNWRFGQFSGGNLRVTVDGVDYNISATAA